MKRLQRVFTVLTVLAMLLCTGCAPSGAAEGKAEQLPRYDELTALIGQSKEAVLNSLSLQEADLTEFAQYEYMTPIEVEYGDVKLKIKLVFTPLPDIDILNGVSYVAVYQNEPERAAKEMLSTAKKLQTFLGESDSGNNYEPAWEMSEDEIVETISSKKTLSKLHYWYMTDKATDTMKSYMQKLKETDLYKQYESLGMNPGYLCELNLSAYIAGTDEEASAYLMITYCIGREPS